MNRGGEDERAEAFNQRFDRYVKPVAIACFVVAVLFLIFVY